MAASYIIYMRRVLKTFTAALLMHPSELFDVKTDKEADKSMCTLFYADGCTQSKQFIFEESLKLNTFFFFY
jgi:hypothetical protein